MSDCTNTIAFSALHLDNHGTGAPTLAPDPEVLLRYRTYFTAKPVISQAQLNAALAIRYQVYCVERKFKDAALFPNRMESDFLDTQSIHGLLIHRASNEAIGTTRLILPGSQSLPIHFVLGNEGINFSLYAPESRTAEVSRFALSREFRRKSLRAPAWCAGTPDLGSDLSRLGLVQVLLQISVDQGITHWAAIMQPTLLRMLAAMGIHFEPVGSLVSYWGIRQPCFCSVAKMLERLFRERPSNWLVVTDGGRLSVEA